MTTRSDQLAAFRSAGGVVETLYTCPAGSRVIVKWLSLFNGSGGAVTSLLGIRQVTTGYVMQFFHAASQADATLLGGELWFVLLPGDALVGYSSVGFAYMTAAGAVL